MAHSPDKLPELLAPAGGAEAFRAAIANGADAVYLGIDRLNARRGAENFSVESLADACRFAHVRGVRVYLTLNVVILPSEIAAALDIVDQAWAAGVDAVIVQDLGLLRAVRRWLPDVRVHSSTQVNAHNTPTVLTLASLGVSRVTLAREVSLEEIGAVVSAGSIEIESFVHGALCMCYSGQCLMSSLIGGRSANRGLCAQPCRLMYELVDDHGGVIQTSGAHLLSPKDLAGIAVLPRLVEAGVAALKIEGRMKNPEYVALVTGVYRSALDRAVADRGDFVVREGELAVLSESFSRGFTEAYLLGRRDNDMMSYKRPNNRGMLVGRVVSTEAGAATIALESQLDSGDTIEFWTSSGRFAQMAGPLAYEGSEHATAPAGVKATVRTERSSGTGDRVFRVRNAALTAAARRTFERAEVGGIPLRFGVRVTVGHALSVTVTDEAGRVGRWEGPMVEPARTKAITADEIVEHVGRLGGTPYRAAGFDIELSPSAGVGFSVLHGARRQAIADYEATLLGPWSGRERLHPEVEMSRVAVSRAVTPDMVVETSRLDVALACLAAGATRAHVPTYELGVGEVPEGVVPMIPRVLHDSEIESALRFARSGLAVAVGSLGLIGEAAAAGACVEAHWSLNALNALSVEQLVELGAGFVWLSPELSGRQIADICRETSAPLGTAVWGRQEVMVTEHCVFMVEGDCEGRCADCGRRRRPRFLRDKKGYQFPVQTDPTGRSHVFNSVRLDLVSALPEIIEAGVAAIRLDVHVETATDAATAVKDVAAALRAAVAGRPIPERPRTSTTSGHYFRGLS